MLLSRPHSDSPDQRPDNMDDKIDHLQNFESDTKKIVRRHLEDKDHVITEEEIASIRIGVTPPDEKA